MWRPWLCCLCWRSVNSGAVLRAAKEEKEKANFDLLLSMPVTPTGDAPRAG